MERCRPTQTDDPKTKKKYKLNSEKSKHHKMRMKKGSGRGSETLLSNLTVQNYNKALIGHLNIDPLFPFPYIYVYPLKSVVETRCAST